MTQRTGGLIEYFNLTGWWLSSFSEADRRYLSRAYVAAMLGDDTPPDQGRVLGTSSSCCGFLTGLAPWSEASQRLDLVDKIAAKAEEVGIRDSSYVDLHFLYTVLIRDLYKLRAIDGMLDRVIDACEKQIAIAQKAAVGIRKEYRGEPLPAHVGYKQLAIIREKESNFTEALRLAKQAKKQKWNGDWDSRIQRLEKKIQSAKAK